MERALGIDALQVLTTNKKKFYFTIAVERAFAIELFFFEKEKADKTKKDEYIAKYSDKKQKEASKVKKLQLSLGKIKMI